MAGGRDWHSRLHRTQAALDLAAVTSLDEASTVELTRSRENLQPLAHSLGGPDL